MTAEPIRVLIADDEALVRGGFRVLVESEDGMTVVGEATDGAAAVDLTRRTRPDVVLLDIRMPGVDGLQALPEIAADPDLAGVHVIVLTTFDHDEYVIEALDAGAGGFLIKNTNPRQLLDGIRVVAGGEALLPPAPSGGSCAGSPSAPGPAGSTPARWPGSPIGSVRSSPATAPCSSPSPTGTVSSSHPRRRARTGRADRRPHAAGSGSFPGRP